MNAIRHDIIQQALIMGDDGAENVSSRSALTPSATMLQRVDIQPGIGFVQDGELGLQHGHLQHFVALLLTAREADIQVAFQQIFRHR